MRKKVGWIWILAAIFLFIADFFTLGNQTFITAEWATMASFMIAIIACPALLIVGIAIFIIGKKK